MSQNDKILSHMRTKGSITTWVAIKRYRITRLARVIGDLKDDGYLINPTWINRNGKRYVAYSLVEGCKRKAA